MPLLATCVEFESTLLLTSVLLAGNELWLAFVSIPGGDGKLMYKFVCLKLECKELGFADNSDDGRISLATIDALSATRSMNLRVENWNVKNLGFSDNLIGYYLMKKILI